MTFIDISFPIRDRMAGFPGDPPVRLIPVRRIADGAAYDLSSLSMSSHTGTHVDPPRHFLPGGAGIDGVDLGRLHGPAWVVEVPSSATVVDAAAVARVPAGTERVLFRTRNSDRWPPRFEFFPDYVGLDDSAAEALLKRGVRLIGIDSLSVEKDASGTFPVHHRLLGGGALILEGIVLGSVPEGPYELACLPLRIVDGDGGPCRAVLRPA